MMSEKEDGYDSSNSSVDDNDDDDDDDDCFYVVDMVADEQGTCNISRLSDDPTVTANLTPSPVKGGSSSGRRRLRKEFSRLKRPIQAIRKNLNKQRRQTSTSTSTNVAPSSTGRDHIPIVNSTILEEDDNIGPMGERSRLSMVVPGDRYYSSTLFSHHLQHQFDHHHHMHIFHPDDDEYDDEDEGRNNQSYHTSNNRNLQAFRDSTSKSWDEEENNDDDDDDDNIHHCPHHSDQQGSSIFDDETTYTGKISTGGDSSYQNSRSVATTTITSSLSSWFPSFSSFSSRHSSFRDGEEELLLPIDGYNDEEPKNNNDTAVLQFLSNNAVIVCDYLTNIRRVLFTVIFERWAFWLFGIYASFFMLFDIVRSSSKTTTATTAIYTTDDKSVPIDSSAGNNNDTTTSTFQLILTIMYASFIITSFGFVWGRSIVLYRKIMSRRMLEQQEQRQFYLQAEVLSAFCNPHRQQHQQQQQQRRFQADNYFTDGSRHNSRSSSKEIAKGEQKHKNAGGARRRRRRKSKNDQYYWTTSWWSHRLAHVWLVPVLVLGLAFAMSQASEWSMIQTLYYVLITGK
jgi:hypothetical protein